MENKIESFNITYFVHGTTYDNDSGICSGWSNVELNEKGKNQAILLGNRIKENGIKFDVCFTSDLLRSINSASFAFNDVKKIVDSRLRECNYGMFDGKEKKFVNYDEHINTPFPNGESLIQVQSRILSFILDLKKNYSGKKIAIVAHRAPQLAFEVLTKNITWDEAIKKDWRKSGNWAPGWNYDISNINVDK